MTPRRNTQLLAAGFVVGFLLCCCLTTTASSPSAKIVLRENFSPSHRTELREQLRIITGWSDLEFDANGNLRWNSAASGGSKSARDLFERAASGKNVIILEETDRRADIAFCRVLPGRWTKDGSQLPFAYVMQIDFEDFHHVMGDRKVREAFNVGWAMLHELEHVVDDLPDAEELGRTGMCEDHINVMRRELGLPERAEYFFTLFPASGDSFASSFVRLAFEQKYGHDDKKRRYWLVWDANAVGGLIEGGQIASAR